MTQTTVVVTVYIGELGSSGELITVQGVGQVQADANNQITLSGRLWGQRIVASWFNWEGSVVATRGTNPTLTMTQNATPSPVP
jgi:hypothetical protein